MLAQRGPIQAVNGDRQTQILKGAGYVFVTVVPIFSHQLAQQRSPLPRETKPKCEDERKSEVIGRPLCQTLLKLDANDLGRSSRICAELRDEGFLREASLHKVPNEAPFPSISGSNVQRFQFDRPAEDNNSCRS